MFDLSYSLLLDFPSNLEQLRGCAVGPVSASFYQERGHFEVLGY